MAYPKTKYYFFLNIFKNCCKSRIIQILFYLLYHNPSDKANKKVPLAKINKRNFYLIKCYKNY